MNLLGGARQSLQARQDFGMQFLHLESDGEAESPSSDVVDVLPYIIDRKAHREDFYGLELVSGQDLPRNAVRRTPFPTYIVGVGTHSSVTDSKSN